MHDKISEIPGKSSVLFILLLGPGAYEGNAPKQQTKIEAMPNNIFVTKVRIRIITLIRYPAFVQQLLVQLSSSTPPQFTILVQGPITSRPGGTPLVTSKRQEKLMMTTSITILQSSLRQEHPLSPQRRCPKMHIAAWEWILQVQQHTILRMSPASIGCRMLISFQARFKERSSNQTRQETTTYQARRTPAPDSMIIRILEIARTSMLKA